MSEPIDNHSYLAGWNAAVNHEGQICMECGLSDEATEFAPSLNQPSPLVKAEALALLDSAFEEEFDLLPEDAKPLCDTFYRSLRKRLGHPVEAAIERPAAPNPRPASSEPLRDQ